jgi:hypothetical protein
MEGVYIKFLQLSGMDHVMSDQTVSLNEDNMVTPVNLKGLSSFFSIDTKYM